MTCRQADPPPQPPLPPPWTPRSLPAHDGGCYGLAFNRTGDLLASGGADKAVKLWDPFTASLKTTLRVGGALPARPSPWGGPPAGTLAPAPHPVLLQGAAQRVNGPRHVVPPLLVLTARFSHTHSQGAFEGVNGVAFTCDGKLALGADNKQVWRGGWGWVGWGASSKQAVSALRPPGCVLRQRGARLAPAACSPACPSPRPPLGTHTPKPSRRRCGCGTSPPRGCATR